MNKKQQAAMIDGLRMLLDQKGIEETEMKEIMEDVFERTFAREKPFTSTLEGMLPGDVKAEVDFNHGTIEIHRK
jgi:hypothetical protein